jgi:hypothetical protein
VVHAGEGGLTGCAHSEQHAIRLGVQGGQKFFNQAGFDAASFARGGRRTAANQKQRVRDKLEFVFRFGFDLIARFLARCSGQFLANFRFLAKLFRSFRHQLVIARAM